MSDLSQLRRQLIAFFDEGELKSLTFDLGLDYEMLPGPAKGDKARELILSATRQGRLERLVELIREARPNIQWPDPASFVSTETENRAAAPASEPFAKQPVSRGNPFTYGNPISDPTRFFGRNREIEQVFDRLRNAEGESSSIVGGRRIGKSSMLNYLAHPDVRRRYGMDPSQSFFVYVDLQMVDQQTTPARLWQRLISQMARQCADEELVGKIEETLAAGSFDNFTLADLFDIVDRQNRHVVFLLDEFENVTSNPNFDPGFFYGLRSLAIQHNLSLITSSNHALIDLTHSQAVRSSPFFNIFANINLRVFTGGEAGKLVTGLLNGTDIAFTEEETETLAEIADGHPFFLQMAAHYLFDAYDEYADAGRRRAAWLSAFRAEAGPHLAHYWRATDRFGQASLLLLAAVSRRAEGRPYFDPAELERHDPRAGQNLAMLVRQGFVTEDAGRFALFSTVFADWIAAEVRTGEYSNLDPTLAETYSAAQANMSAERRKALASLAGQIADGYRLVLVSLLDQSVDPIATRKLIQNGINE